MEVHDGLTGVDATVGMTRNRPPDPMALATSWMAWAMAPNARQAVTAMSL